MAMGTKHGEAIMVMESDGGTKPSWSWDLMGMLMLMVILVLMVLMSFILKYLDVGPGFYILIATARLCPIAILTISDDYAQ